MKKGEIVIFNKLKNARGYLLTGIVEVEPYTNDSNEEVIDVTAFGLYGPGSDTLIHGVLMTDVRPDWVKPGTL